jgi:mono/diheme cytochrome c family protein
MTGAKRRTRLLPFAVCLLPLISGCRQDMHDAPRYDPLEASAVYLKGSSARPLVEGTVARGELRDDALLDQGKVGGEPADVFPFAIDHAALDRGEERYNVYCAPCHSRLGDGNGMVVQRGYRQAASFHTDRLRDAKPGYIFDVITNGFGVMPDYKAQIPVDDRWKIVAYVRALQLSHHATTADVAPGDIGKLDQPASEQMGAAGAGHGEEKAAGHKAGGTE